LNDKSDLSGRTEIPNNQKANDFQETLSSKAFFITSNLAKIFKFDWRNLHDVANIQILNPFSLVQKPKNMSQINLLLILLFFQSFLIGVWLFAIGFVKIRDCRHAHPYF